MKTNEKTMTASEWEVMRIIWTLGEATSRQLIRILGQKNKWSPSTVKTLITRLQTKGYLADNGATRDRLFTPTIPEIEAMTATLTHTVRSMCAMCVGRSLIAVIDDTPLSQQDITNLQQLLRDKQSHAPQSIACDCMPTHGEDFK